MMVPVSDEKSAKGKLPQSLLLQVKDVDIVRTRIRNLFTLRHMLLSLTRNDGESLNLLKEQPIKREESKHWKVGASCEMPSDGEMTLCNVKLNQKMNIRFVVFDSESFILVEPEFPNQPPRFKVHVKQSLKLLESMIDKSDPRNLKIGYPNFGKDTNSYTIEDHLLYFENT